MFVLAKVTVANAQVAKSFNGTPSSPQELVAKTKLIADHRERVNSGIISATVKVSLLWRPFFFTSLLSGIFAAVILLGIQIMTIWTAF
jgi:hypothetical protein